MKTAPRCLFLLGCLCLAACKPASPGPAPGAPASGAPPAAEAFSEGSERMWSGLLPCSDCQGVETRLVLRLRGGKRDFEMLETYIGGSPPNTFIRRGAWLETAGQGEGLATYVLDPGRAAQEFSLQPDGSLQLLDGRGKPLQPAVANRLERL